MQNGKTISLAPSDATHSVAQSGPVDVAAAAPPALDRALRLVGAEHEAELLDRLAADLARVAEALAVACVRQDREDLRGTAHVLTALLGTVGEAADAEAAGALRAAIAAGAWPEIDRAGNDVACRVARLQEAVAARRASRGRGAEGGAS